MPQCVRRRLRFTTSMIPTITPRYFMLITCLSIMVSVIWIQLIENGNSTNQTEHLVTEALRNVARDHRYAEVYRKVEKLQKDMKYILIWTPYEFAPFYYFGDGQRKFIDLNCPNINCYVTTDVNFFNGDTTKFHAIAFNGRNVDEISKLRLPKYRSPHQKFIYFNLESADNYPVCSDVYDGFFNWTSTYRLDSDLPYPYIQVKNFRGEIIGPKKDMKWITDNEASIDDDLEMIIQNKTKAVAWFVSHCSSRSGRKEYAKLLQKALKKYGLSVDIYGACGTFKCPRSQKNSCFSFLEKDYFFYLSFENSFSDDYVTEKLLTALNHNVVPIVFGGANYSRFV